MRTMLAIIVALVIWIIFCAIADYGLELGANSWRMLWGYVAGIVAAIVYETINPKDT